VIIIGCLLLAFGALLLLGHLSNVIYLLVRRPEHGCSFLPPFGAPLAFLGATCIPCIGWKLGLVAFALEPLHWAFAVFAISRLWK
jgi:hypothetical protein